MYNIWERCYPQADINFTEEMELEPFSSLERANAFIADIEKMYADEDWCGHRMYKAKFYAMEV